MKIIKLSIPKIIITEAVRLSPKEAINDRSITNGARNVVGTIAELCTMYTLTKLNPETKINYSPCYDYDMIVDGVRFDVKTKQRTVAPRSDYDCSIVAYSKDKQRCDSYIFTSVTLDRQSNAYTEFYLIGYMPKTDYFNSAVFKKKGEPDGGNNIFKNGKLVEFKIVEDCYNLKYADLKPFDIKKSFPSSGKFTILEI